MEDKRTTYIDLYGKRYPLCFTVSAQERVSQTFGGMDKMAERMADDSAALDATVTLIQILMCGGRDRVKALAWMAGEEADTPEVPELPVLKNLILLTDLKEYQNQAFLAIGVSTEKTVEVAPETGKNADATQG